MRYHWLRAAFLFAFAVSSLALPRDVSANDDVLHTWCMTGWAGEVCFDVVNFRVQEDWDVRVGGYWRQPGLPAEGTFDDLGRWRPSNGAFRTFSFFDAVNGVDCWLQTQDKCYADHQLVSAELYQGVVPPVGSGPYDASTWDTPHCYVTGLAGSGYTVSWNADRCGAVSVPEPSSVLLLATGLLGLLYARRRRA